MMQTGLQTENPEWWRGAVIYQIYPRSFADANGDGIGDLPGITEHMDYLASLGIDALWLSPFYTSPMRDFGYDIADYTGVDSIFGQFTDFENLLAAAHRHGIRVIIDQVWSHTSNEHPWFQQSRQDRDNPKADWYVWADPKPDGTPPNNWLASFGGSAWSWDGLRGQYYLHNFLPSQPDLNVRNPEVQEALLDVGRYWLDAGVDGFRFDVANYFMHDPQLRDNPPHPRPLGPAPYWRQQHLNNKSQPDNIGLLHRIRELLDSYGNGFALAEILDENNIQRMAEYTAPGRLHSAYSFAFLRGALTPVSIREQAEAFFAHDPKAWPTWAFSNHDTARVVSRVGPNDPAAQRDFAKLLNTLLCSLPGTVCVYQGEELGLTQVDVPKHRLRDPEALAHWPHHRNRDGARTPMPWLRRAPDHGFGCADPWLPFGPDHGVLSVEAQDADPDSVLQHFRALLAWRKAQPALRTAPIQFLSADEQVLAFERQVDRLNLLFLFNFSAQTAAWQQAGQNATLRPYEARIFDAK